MKKIIPVAIIIALAGCATPYQKDGLTGGFTETQLSDNVWRVSFRGNGYTSGTRAEDYALLRCAELTLEKGFTHFGLMAGNVSNDVGAVTMPTTTTTTGFVSGYGIYSGSSTTTGGQTFFVSSPTADNMVVMFKGKPEIQGMIFDAKFVCASLGSKYEVQCLEQPK